MKNRMVSAVCFCMVLFAAAGCGPEKPEEPFAGTRTETEAVTEEMTEAATEKTTEEGTTGAAAEETTGVKTGTFPERETAEEEETPRELVIELDPGHGGKKCGAENESYGVLEKDVNLEIAKYLKAELETYDHVTVYLTREDDSHVELEDRVAKAVKDGADMLISLHNNGTGSIVDYYEGCTVLVGRGVYEEALCEEEQELGCCILKELEELGVENQGLMFRVTQDDIYYENGELCDYYSIVRNALKAGIGGIIVEHAFMDSETDFRQFLSDGEKLKALAEADARGIAACYGLKKPGGVREEPLQDYEEKITVIYSDYYEDNEYLTKRYFTKP